MTAEGMHNKPGQHAQRTRSTCTTADGVFSKALTYLQNNAKELNAYLEDGRLEISNNLSERSIKPFVIDGKRNYIQYYRDSQSERS